MNSEGDAAINITRADFHGEWNYTIQPSNPSKTSVDPSTIPKDRVCSPLCEQCQSLVRALARLLGAWVKGAGAAGHVAIDGKRLRGTCCELKNSSVVRR